MEISCSMERRTIKILGGESALGHVLEEDPKKGNFKDKENSLDSVRIIESRNNETQTQR